MTLTIGDDGLSVVDLRFDSLRHLQEELGPYLALEGFFLRGETSVSPSDVVRFRMMLPGDFVLVEGAGVIIWVREAHEAGPLDPVGAAIGFATLSEQGRELVERMVQTHVENGGKQFDLSRSAAAAGAATDPDATHVLQPSEVTGEEERGIRFMVRGEEASTAEDAGAIQAGQAVEPGPQESTSLDLPFEETTKEEDRPAAEPDMSFEVPTDPPGTFSPPLDHAYEALKGAAAGNALSREAEAEASEGFSAFELEESPDTAEGFSPGDPVPEPAVPAAQPPVEPLFQEPVEPLFQEPVDHAPVDQAPVDQAPVEPVVEPPEEPLFEPTSESESAPAFDQLPAIEEPVLPPMEPAATSVEDVVPVQSPAAEALDFVTALPVEGEPDEPVAPADDFEFKLPTDLNASLSEKPAAPVVDEVQSRDSVTVDRDFSARRPRKPAGKWLLWIAAVVVVCGGAWVAWQQFAGDSSWWPFGAGSENEPFVARLDPEPQDPPENADLALSEAEVAAAVDAAVEAASGGAPAEAADTTGQEVAGVETETVAEVQPGPTPTLVPVVPVVPLRPATALSELSWNEVDGGTVVTIRGNGSIARDRVRDDGLSAPPRILIRMRDIRDSYRPLEYQVGGREIAKIRFGHHTEKTPPSMWIVFDLTDEAAQVLSVAAEGDTVTILIGPGN